MAEFMFTIDNVRMYLCLAVAFIEKTSAKFERQLRKGFLKNLKLLML
jgi:hypothetical protein